MKIIARIRTDFPAKFGIPRQSGLIDELNGTVVFEPTYRNADALRGLEEFSHIWLVWKFSTNSGATDWTPMVRPPKLGGNTKVGVFASRSPFRPNPLGLSCVKLTGMEQTEKYGTVLHVSGIDLMDGTEIVDIKPYIPYTDCRLKATGGFSRDSDAPKLNVIYDEEALSPLPDSKRAALVKVLELDPRPAYQDDAHRVYGFSFAGYEIKFTVSGDTLYIREITTE